LGLSYVTEFVFEATRPDGVRSRIRPPGRDGFQPAGRLAIPPGGREVATIVLNEWMRFDRLGRYRVALIFDGRVTANGTPVTVERSGEWDMTLRPRDQEVLRSRCDEYLRAILGPSPGEQQRALLALTWIRDPVAVPYLLKSAEARQLALEEVNALTWIGGSEARAALETLARGPNPWTATQAKAALARMR
jgi:hypothetical protein